MIKVCHMTSVHAPEDVRIFHKECTSLAKAGYDVYLVERGSSYEKNGVNIIGVGEPKGGRLSRMTEFSKRIYKAALEINADIYHFHDPELLPYGLKLKKMGKKVIFDSHEKYTLQLRTKSYLPKWIMNMIAKCYGKYEEFVLKQIDAVVFPCTMNGCNPFKGKCRRAMIISNVTLLEEFFDRYDADCLKKDQICYVGGLTVERGITMDMKAAKVAGITLALAGKFSPPEYERQLMSMNEFSCVDYRGQLDRGDVARLLLESKVGLCTLLNRGQYFKIDTFGNKVFEYMSMALPVILSRNTYNQSMIEKYKFGICVNPEDVEEISDAIRYLLDNPDIAQKMGENGRRAIKEEFNWSIEEKKLLELYDDILKSESDKA